MNTRRLFLKKASVAGVGSLLLGNTVIADTFKVGKNNSEILKLSRNEKEDMSLMSSVFKKMNNFKKISEFAPDFIPELKISLNDSVPKELKKAWELAIFEVESNIADSPFGGRYFTAGGRGGYYGMVFGQDTFGSGLLALNKLYPELMKSQIRTYCLARLNIGFIGPIGWEIENFEKTVPLKKDVWGKSREFIKRYNISPALNKTGLDVGWIWTAGDLFELHGDLLDWAWLYSMGELFFEHFYNPFYDESDELYWGQAWPDVGGDGYPPEFRGGQSSRNKCLWTKSTSTNCIYVKNMEVMAYAARLLDMPEKAIVWEKRAKKLKLSILDRLRLENGTFSYFKHKDGHLEVRNDALGTALAIISGVVSGEEAILSIKDYPITEIGVPLLYPFYEGDYSFHNNSSWPFVNAFFMFAVEKATGKSYIKESALMAAHSIHNEISTTYSKTTGINNNDISTGTFAEVINWNTKKPFGTIAQLWSICGFLNLCINAGWISDTSIQEESQFFSLKNEF